VPLALVGGWDTRKLFCWFGESAFFGNLIGGTDNGARLGLSLDWGGGHTLDLIRRVGDDGGNVNDAAGDDENALDLDGLGRGTPTTGA